MTTKGPRMTTKGPRMTFGEGFRLRLLMRMRLDRVFALRIVMMPMARDMGLRPLLCARQRLPGHDRA